MTTPPGQPPEFPRPDDQPTNPHGGSSSYGQPSGAGQPWEQQQQYPQQQYPQQQYPQQGYPGAPAGYGPGQDQPQKSNGFGIAALVLGILSLPAAFLAGVPGILLGGLAIIFGILGLRRVKARRADNKGMAIAGLVTGAIGLVLGVFILVAAVFIVSTTADCQNEFNQTGDQAQFEQCIQDSVSN